MMRLEKVRKVYGKGTTSFTALDEINLNIEQGSMVALVGKSGSGKSTLMHIMSGLDRPTSGNVYIDGSDLWSRNKQGLDRFRNEKMAFVFQTFYIQPNETCLENVMLPLEIRGMSFKERKDKAMIALEMVGLEGKAKNDGKDLSGGQRQRLCIARAIVGEQDILFADEPTGNLDTKTGKEVFELLKNIHQLGKTIVLVTHDTDLAKECDGEVTIVDGHIESVSGKGVAI